MPSYNFTSDLRISELRERIERSAHLISDNQLLLQDKSTQNNGNTLAFYFNLHRDTRTMELAKSGYITEIIRNMVLKFQFPNMYTKEIFDKNIEEQTYVAPLREIVKLLTYLHLTSGWNSVFLTQNEILYHIFCNNTLWNGTATPAIYTALVEEIVANRNNNFDYTNEISANLQWSQYLRQSRELISIITYVSDAFKYHGGAIHLNIPLVGDTRYADIMQFLYTALAMNDIWRPTSLYSDAIRQEYIDYLDMDGEVITCAQVTKPNIEQSTPIKKSSLPLQVIYYGAPGTGKSYRIDREAPEELTVRTTFHPDSDYAGFVGAYKPTMESVPMTAFMGKEVHRATPTASHSGMERKIVYKFVPQAFLKAYVEAWSDLERPHFLVIEEINRGNCAQVFGDLFQLLDRNDQGASAYAIAADEDVAAFLRDDARGFADLSDSQRAAIEEFVLVKDSGQQWAIGRDILEGRKLLLPPNLHIWATMNTSDQSLFPIDSAFKRRWNWRFVPIDYAVKQHLFEVGGKRYSWGDFLHEINPMIYNLTESADKQMGYFFAKPDLCSSPASGVRDLISEEVFVNKVLFYLWTDVLKDFEPQAPFVDATGRLYKFSDFFDPSTGALQRFMDGLELEEVATAKVDAEGEESEEVEA